MQTRLPDRPVATPTARDADGKGCAGGCNACKMISRMDDQVPPRQYMLGALWAFVLPMVGLIIGSALAGQCDGYPAWQALAIAGGLAVGIVLGVIGRKVTLPAEPAQPCGTERGKA